MKNTTVNVCVDIKYSKIHCIINNNLQFYNG